MNKPASVEPAITPQIVAEHGLTPEEYLKANYEPGDHLAVLLHHRAKGDTIQRVNTKGGKPPAAGCDVDHVDKEVRSAYSADYNFYAIK